MNRLPEWGIRGVANFISSFFSSDGAPPLSFLSLSLSLGEQKSDGEIGGRVWSSRSITVPTGRDHPLNQISKRYNKVPFGCFPRVDRHRWLKREKFQVGL
jgi:hypothetical protein